MVLIEGARVFVQGRTIFVRERSNAEQGPLDLTECRIGEDPMKPRSILCVLGICLPIVGLSAFADDRAPNEPTARLNALEREVRDLTKRIETLESHIKATGKPGANVPPTLATWRQLRKGMSEDDVRRLLGEPKRIEAGSLLNFWRYANFGSVHFSESGKVEGWDEPR